MASSSFALDFENKIGQPISQEKSLMYKSIFDGLFTNNTLHNMDRCRPLRKYFILSDTLFNKNQQTTHDDPAFRCTREHLLH